MQIIKITITLFNHDLDKLFRGYWLLFNVK
jgi:hypothetical protein